jgi:subtilisin family serine protease
MNLKPHPLIWRLAVGLALLLLPLNGAAAARPDAWTQRVDPWVLAQAVAGPTDFLIELNTQADLSDLPASLDKAARGAEVYRRLTAVAAQTQGPLLAQLEAAGAPHQAYWISNVIWARGDVALLRAVAARPEVGRLRANPRVQVDLPTAEAPLGPHRPSGIEWNIAKVGAPDLWAAGYQGQGVVIGGQDTGYDWEHPTLKRQYRGWDGTTANHDYNWHDAIHYATTCPADSPVPCDDQYHGTHTMGTMVGADGPDPLTAVNAIGMAPGARWIGCRNMGDGNGTPQTYMECYQWFVAPTKIDGSAPDPSRAPDIINNSWSCPVSEGCTDPTVLQAVVANVRAAGILTVHSAGNDGSACSTINTPAAIYDDSFTVANTRADDTLAPSSSRGPVTLGGVTYMKPDISAPGTSIRSSVPNAQYRALTGTSMAGPHVAGMAALLLSAQPELRGHVAQIEARLTQTALPLTTPSSCGGYPGDVVPNPFFGWGRIDGVALLNTMPPPLPLHATLPLVVR